MCEGKPPSIPMWANTFLQQSTLKRKLVERASPSPRQSQTPDVRNTSWEVLLAPLRAEGRGKARELEPRELAHYRNWHIPQRGLGWLPSSPLAICSKKTLWNKKAPIITLLGYGSKEQLLQRRGGNRRRVWRRGTVQERNPFVK